MTLALIDTSTANIASVRYALNRLGVEPVLASTPEDAAGVAIFLASRASAYTTGATIPVDGGSAEV